MAEVAFTVEDMSCGHCVATITKAIESKAPGARVTTDLGTKRVTVSGAPDASAVEAIIIEAGYTPRAV